MGGFDYLEYAVGIGTYLEDWELRVLCLYESTFSLSRGWMGGERNETPPGATRITNDSSVEQEKIEV